MNSRRCSSYALNSFRHYKQKLKIFQSQLSFIDGKARDVKNAIAKEISKAIICTIMFSIIADRKISFFFH